MLLSTGNKNEKFFRKLNEYYSAKSQNQYVADLEPK